MTKQARAEKLLMEFYIRNGCIRLSNRKRLKRENRQKYKKGYEIRFIAMNAAERIMISRLLKECGFKKGRPYKKNNRIVIPVYGKQEMEEFLSLKGFS